MQQMNFELDRDLYPDNIERSWSQLMMLFQERDQMIHEEIARLEKLQRLAEKIHAEAKQCYPGRMMTLRILHFRFPCSLHCQIP